MYGLFAKEKNGKIRNVILKKLISRAATNNSFSTLEGILEQEQCYKVTLSNKLLEDNRLILDILRNASCGLYFINKFKIEKDDKEIILLIPRLLITDYNKYSKVLMKEFKDYEKESRVKIPIYNESTPYIKKIHTILMKNKHKKKIRILPKLINMILLDLISNSTEFPSDYNSKDMESLKNFIKNKGNECINNTLIMIDPQPCDKLFTLNPRKQSSYYVTRKKKKKRKKSSYYVTRKKKKKRKKRKKSSEDFGSMADTILKGKATRAFNKHLNRRKPQKINKPKAPRTPKAFRSSKDTFSDSSSTDNIGIENYKMETEIKEHFQTKNIIVSIIQSIIITTIILFLLKNTNSMMYNITSHLVINPDVFIKNFSKKIINK